MMGVAMHSVSGEILHGALSWMADRCEHGM